jgi:hypothetical protein
MAGDDCGLYPELCRKVQVERKKRNMTAFYRIDKQSNLVVIHAEGVLTRRNFEEVRRHMMSDPDFDPQFSMLADCSAVTHVDLTAGEIRVLADMSPFDLTGRRAIVARRDVVYGLARMFEIVRSLRGDQHIRVFRNCNEALAWLFLKDQAA